jgi:hypothetical protein
VATEAASHWETVALPVLQRLAEREDELRQRGLLQLGLGTRGSEALGLEIQEGELFDALFQLQDLGYITFDMTPESGPGALFVDLRVTGRGLQVLGEWPRFEAWISPQTLAAFAEQMAEFAPSDDRPRLTRAAAYLRARAPATIKGAAIALGSQMVRSGLGLP